MPDKREQPGPALATARAPKRTRATAPTPGRDDSTHEYDRSGSVDDANRDALSTGVKSALWEDLCELVPGLVPQEHEELIEVAERNVEVMSRLFQKPMTTSDDDLAKAVLLRRLERSTASDRAEWRTRQTFYVRSWRMTVAELRIVVESWRREGKQYGIVDVWNGLIAESQLHDNDAVWVRYVGTTKRDGYTRFVEDRTGRTNGQYHSFVTTVEKRLPEVSRNWAVYEFVRASIPEPAPLQLVDHRERLLIALLGYGNRGLLNRQPGGYYANIVVSPKDGIRFAALKTTISGLSMQKAEKEVLADLEGWAKQMSLFAETHLKETRTDEFPLPANWHESILRQATPSTEHNLFALVGREVTQTDFKGGWTYLGPRNGARSQSAKITAEILGQLMKLEQDVQPATAVDIESRFPFVDLYPWIGEEETPAMLDFLRRYFEIAGPMLAVGLGCDVSSSLAANFWHQYGLPKSEFLNSVGVPTLQNFDKSWLESDDPEPKDNGYFISIPHYDPGYEKYACQ
jgi:hypothetical protein